MRTTTAIVWVLAMLSTSLYTYGEPIAQDAIHFARPLGGALLGAFKAGQKVTLVNGNETCAATTGSPSQFEHLGESIDETGLNGMNKCQKHPIIAVVGADPEIYQIHLPEQVHSPLPDDIESKARQIVEAWFPPSVRDTYGLASPHPKALRVGRFTLLKFRWKGEGEEGPAVLLFNDRLLQLEVNCTSGHVFFSINRRLYLAYHEGGCFNGHNIVYVYDLSGESPKIVYCGDLST